MSTPKPKSKSSLSLESLPHKQLQEMQAAAVEIKNCYRVLSKVNFNIVGECLKNQGKFFELNHYPEGDVYDWETHSQYYYHAHRGIGGEHGHFHTFVRAKGMPAGVAPVAYDGDEKWPEGDQALSHLIAISMDKAGYPIGLFAVNRWVTGETWYSADDVKSMLDNFLIDHAWPAWPVNRWISAMTILFRPQIESLLDERDEVVAQWAKKHSDRDVFEDRKLEITGSCKISVDKQLAEIERLLPA